MSLSNRAAPESRGGRAPQRSPVLHPLIGTHSCRRWKHVGTRTSPSRSHESRFCHGKRPPNSASRAGAGIEPCIYPYTFVRSDRQSISKLCPPSAVYGQRRNQGRAPSRFLVYPYRICAALLVQASAPYCLFHRRYFEADVRG